MKDKAREERVTKLAGMRLISKAVQTIISPGVAADTPTVEEKLIKKFPPRVREVEDPGVLLEAMAAEVGDFMKDVSNVH